MTALVNPFWYVVVGGDPFFANVGLLLHLDGADLSTTITDSSSAARTCTTGGTGSLITAQAKFGTASWSGTGSGNISVADNAAWAFGAGQFTVEAWVRPTSAVSGVRAIVAQFASTTNLGWEFGFNGNTLNFFYSTTGTDTPSIGGAYTPTLNAWVHIAADRDASNVLRVYAGGAVIASATVSATFFDSSRALVVGNDGNFTRALVGQVDEVRITKGVARYGGAFTPPTAAFPDF